MTLPRGWEADIGVFRQGWVVDGDTMRITIRRQLPMKPGLYEYRSVYVSAKTVCERLEPEIRAALDAGLDEEDV